MTEQNDQQSGAEAPQLLTSYTDPAQIPESHRSLYRQRQDGLHVLQAGEANGIGVVTVASGNDDAGELRRALDRVRSERDDYKSRQSAIDSEMEALRKQLEGLKSSSSNGANGNGAGETGGLTQADVDRLVAEARADAEASVREAVTGELTPKIEHANGLAERIQNMALNDRRERLVGQVAAELGVDPIFIGALVDPFLKVEFDPEKNEITEQVLNSDGTPWLTTADGERHPATVQDLARRLKENDPRVKAIAREPLGGTAGARGGADAATRSDSTNHFDLDTPNRVPALAAKLIQSNPAEARILASQATNLDPALQRMLDQAPR